MSANAAIYAPIQFFPEADQLRILSRGAEVTEFRDNLVADLEWADGPTLRFTRMPDGQVPAHLAQLRDAVANAGGDQALLERVMSTLSVFAVVVEPDLDPAVIRFIATFTGASNGFCFINDKLVDGDGNDLLAEPAEG